MTDRINALTVVLDRDYRDDDVEAIVAAIRMVRGVVSVEQRVVSANDYIIRMRLVYELRNKLVEAVCSVVEANEKEGIEP